MRRARRGAWRLLAGAAVLAASCAPPEPSPLPPHAFAFGVFGDGPYRSWEIGRFRRLVDDVNRADLRWLLHVGDLLWFPCSDAVLADRLQALNSIRHPVVYTPGDNEWADCHDAIAGGFQPLDRLRFIRSTFFAHPGSSLGGRAMRLESQSAERAWAEFVENARWRYGGFLFVTIHMVGSANAAERFAGRTRADDDEVARRTEAALAWIDAAFSLAGTESSSGVVLALHGDPYFDRAPGFRAGYRTFVERLERHVRAFPGPVILIHGDTHTFRVDHPLRRSDTGEIMKNFTRLETYGSPDIGWVRVVVDPDARRVLAIEPRLMPRRLFW